MSEERDMHEKHCETYHDINLLLDLRQHRLIGHSDTLKDMMRRVVHGSSSPDKIYMCESS